jgi:hypothetical protein
MPITNVARIDRFCFPGTTRRAKRALVAVAGSILALAGVALLVLPGPGFVLVAAGLAILATEFAWVKSPCCMRRRRRPSIQEAGRSPWRAVLGSRRPEGHRSGSCRALDRPTW